MLHLARKIRDNHQNRQAPQPLGPLPGRQARGLHEHHEPSVGTFEKELLLLFERYPTHKREKDEKDKERTRKILRNHWTLPTDYMTNLLHKGTNVDTEIFASPLNVYLDAKHYYSKYDRDKVFGALGEAYDAKTWVGRFEF